jgi:hypothetical protein
MLFYYIMRDLFSFCFGISFDKKDFRIRVTYKMFTSLYRISADRVILGYGVSGLEFNS